jgi:trehalose utilization protein
MRIARDSRAHAMRGALIGALIAFVGLASAGTAAAQAWQARHNMTAAVYQQTFDALTKQGYRLTDVSGYAVNGQPYFAAIWEQKPGGAWQARHNMTAAAYQQAFDAAAKQGYRLTHISGYTVNNQPYFAAIWEQKPGGAWQARHNMTAAAYQQAFDTFAKQGYRLTDVSGYSINNQPYFAAIWEKKAGGAWQARHNMTAATYQQAFDTLAKQGYRLTGVTGYAVNNQAEFAALWEQQPGGAWQARHNMTAATYQQTFDALAKQGYRLRHVAGYTVNGSPLFAAIWAK